jgi:hypothetical protein
VFINVYINMYTCAYAWNTKFYEAKCYSSVQKSKAEIPDGRFITVDTPYFHIQSISPDIQDQLPANEIIR